MGDLFAHADPKWPDNEDEATGPDTVSVGWNFNQRFGGKGYAFEAAYALSADLFANQGARRKYVYVEDHNARSRRLCRRLGMREEGLFCEFHAAERFSRFASSSLAAWLNHQADTAQ